MRGLRSLRERSGRQMRLALEATADPSGIRFDRALTPDGDAAAPRWERAGRRALLWALPVILAVLAIRHFGSNITEGVLRHVGGFPVQQVLVEGAEWVPSAEVVRRAGKLLGTELYDVDESAVRARVLADPRFSSVEVRRKLFHAVVLRVTERRPEALLAGGVLQGVDAQGIAFPVPEDRTPRELPFFSGEATAEARRLVLTALGELRASHPDVYRRVAEVQFSGYPDLTLVLTGGGTPVRIGAPDLAMVGRRLPRVLDQLHAEGRSAAYVDLRFADRAYVKPAGPVASAARRPPVSSRTAR